MKHFITRQMSSSFILVLCPDDPDINEFIDSWVGVKANQMSDEPNISSVHPTKPSGSTRLRKTSNIVDWFGKEK